MVLISINSLNADNGYDFNNDFSEALVIDPKATISLVNVYFKRKDQWVVTADNNDFSVKLGSVLVADTPITLTQGTYTGNSLAGHISTQLNNAGNATGFYFKCYYDNVNSQFKFITSTQDASGTTPVNWVGWFYRTAKPGLGDLIGFGQSQMYITSAQTSASNELVSDTEPIPEASKNYNDIIQININNLPLNSIVGQKVTDTAVVNGLCSGSVNGVTRLIAQLPRYMNESGEGSPDNFGPFFYNYFPYSVPLNNAHSLNINDLQITITNIDGTLATDISDCNLLISVSKEENIGGSGPETIGEPMKEAQAPAQSNQFQPQLLPPP